MDTKATGSFTEYEDLTELFRQESTHTGSSRQDKTLGEIDSPIKKLKAVVLSLDWEITDISLKAFQAEIGRLQGLWKSDKHLLLLLRILKALGDYLNFKKSDVLPETIHVLSSTYNNLEKIALSKNIPTAQKSKIALGELKKYEELKAKLNNLPGSDAATDPHSRTASKGESADVKTSAAGNDDSDIAEILPALDDIDTGDGEPRRGSRWSKYSPFQEVDERLNDFFGEDHGLKESSVSPEITGQVTATETQEINADRQKAPDPQEKMVPPSAAETVGVGQPAILSENKIPAPPGICRDEEELIIIDEQSPRDTPVYPLKKLIDSIDASIDKATMRDLNERIKSFKDNCTGTRAVDILLQLLQATGNSVSLVGRNAPPGYIKLLKSLYGKLEHAYPAPPKNDTNTLEYIHGDLEKFIDMQNKIIHSLAVNLVKSRKSLQSAKNSAAQMKRQLDSEKAAPPPCRPAKGQQDMETKGTESSGIFSRLKGLLKRD